MRHASSSILVVVASVVLSMPGLAGEQSARPHGQSETAGQPATASLVSDPAYAGISALATAGRDTFWVYRDLDSGLNHGFASGFFPTSGLIELNAGCVYDPAVATGCATNPTRLDTVHGSVLAITFKPLAPGTFSGLHIEEPERFSTLHGAPGYNLAGASRLVFDALVPTPGGLTVQFGLADHVSTFRHIPQSTTFQTFTFDFVELGVTASDLTDTHLLFTITTNDEHAPAGGTILLDNIRLEPVPVRQATQPVLPLANITYGVIPVANALGGRVPIPPDQILRNLSTLYESSIAAQALFLRATSDPTSANAATAADHARRIADALVYALDHPNHGIALPAAPGGARGLQSALSSGDMAFNSSQSIGAGQQGDIRLAGFSGSTSLCGPTGFCVVLDGATGGNNAFAILALLTAYVQSSDTRYLTAAHTIATWVDALLRDPATDGYGGYFLGYPDQGVTPKPLLTGKSIENNADMYAAFLMLASVERTAGTGTPDVWADRAKRAGDFVMAMFDDTTGRFYAGTVPVGTAAGPGITPNGPTRGADVINTFDFIDANTFSILALAESPFYRARIDWRRPLQWALDHQARTVAAAGRSFSGFNIVAQPTAGPDGIAWEFTGQMIVAMKLVDRLYAESRFTATAALYLDQLRLAQTVAPFADGNGIPASTMQNGDTLPPYEHCVSTPFQCIAQRIGLASTVWAVFADTGFNPLGQTDGDGDGTPDAWETQYGLDAQDPSDGAADPDQDGISNLAEYQRGLHPRGFHTRYFAEGSESTFFHTRLALMNPGDEPARVLLRFLRFNATQSSMYLVLAGKARTTLDLRANQDLGQTDFSTTIEADQLIVADRNMTWAGDQAYGSASETAVTTPAPRWLLAEGATHGGFDLFYLLQNANDTAAQVHIRYLLPSGEVLEKDYVVEPQSRKTVYVDTEDIPGHGLALAATDVSAIIEVTNNQPIIVERSMYFSTPAQAFAAGHVSVAVSEPSTTWFLAEGATGSFFDMFLLFANPTATTAQVETQYLLASGAVVTKVYPIAPFTRVTKNVAFEDPLLADAAVSVAVRVQNDVPIIVERSLWWPHGQAWHEAHNVVGATKTGTRWAVADGEVGAAPANTQTYLLVANTSPFAATVRATILSSERAPLSKDFVIQAHSRFNINTQDEFPGWTGNFSAIIESLGDQPAQIVVERAMYSDANGIVWAAGSDLLATRLQ